MDLSNARFGTVIRDQTTAIVGRIIVGFDAEVVLYDLNGVMVAATHPLVFSPTPLPFQLVSDDDRRSLGLALAASQEHGEVLDDLWLQVLTDTGVILPVVRMRIRSWEPNGKEQIDSVLAGTNDLDSINRRVIEPRQPREKCI